MAVTSTRAAGQLKPSAKINAPSWPLAASAAGRARGRAPTGYCRASARCLLLWAGLPVAGAVASLTSTGQPVQQLTAEFALGDGCRGRPNAAAAAGALKRSR